MRRIVLWLGLVLLATPQAHAEAPMSPRDYQRLLGVGVDVDWAKTPRAMRYYSREQARAFKEIGFDHVRIRVREAATPELLDLYRRTLAEVRKTNPTRIVFVSPRLRSAPEYLHELDPLFERDPYLMAEWHFYASGPSKHNPKKKWTTGTPEEKRRILDKIALARAWQRATGGSTWVGAWMPGNYNKGDDYAVSEQVAFATFTSCALRAADIPFAVNQANKFYDDEAGRWREAMLPVVEAVVRPRCP
ncbi:hypothetical protein [Oceanithermus sp.]|uniref:hypothetical protein n=1 Tax=Oceanithermus sp. TaxID=2268145 RepID=UPI0025EAB48B|nr:hypothetical protein [Oceanithermus sp.]